MELVILLETKEAACSTNLCEMKEGSVVVWPWLAPGLSVVIDRHYRTVNQRHSCTFGHTPRLVEPMS